MGVLDTAVVVGLIGTIDPRKNPDIVAAACAQAFQKFAGQLLVVGRLSEELGERIKSSGLTSQQLVIREGYASEDDLVAAAAACDIIALLYDNAYSPSGVLALACQVGASVLVPAETRLAEMASMAGIGIACDIDAHSAADAVTSAVQAGLALRKAKIQKAASRLNDADFTNKLIG
jgi:glycosyltransferase involved in cell wall biosynthesis